MSKDERSLLLYLESRCVDDCGIIDSRRMNETDFAIARRWNDEGYVEFGRLKVAEIRTLGKEGQFKHHYVRLTDRAWADAHRLRRERSHRMIVRWTKKHFVPLGVEETKHRLEQAGAQ